MIRTVLFDVDNTLLDFSKAEKNALTKTLRQLGIEPGETILERYSELNLAQWKLLEQGKLSRGEVKVRRYRLLFEEIGADCSPEKAARIYEELLGIGHFFMEGAEELLEELYQKYNLYLVTNGTAAVQRRRLKSAGLKKYVQGIFISEEMGSNKPAKEYFDRCFEQIPGFRKEETVIIGDSLTSDIQGGKNTGIRTIWFNPGRLPNDSGPAADYEIASLREIGPLLYEISKAE